MYKRHTQQEREAAIQWLSVGRTEEEYNEEVSTQWAAGRQAYVSALIEGTQPTWEELREMEELEMIALVNEC